MESSMAESTQQLLIPGKCVDMYYPDPETAKKQCFRTSTNTKFIQQFANLGAGVSVFTIPPQNGIQDVILQFQLPTLPSSAGLAVPRGWGYALIKQISYRVGGSSQYFLTGAQMLQAALKNCPNAQARDDLYALGGQALTDVSTPVVGAAGNYAYVWLQLPFTVPTSQGKRVPLPSDLLTQQIQLTVELNPLSAIYSVNGVVPAPSQLASAQFQVQQVALMNQGDALARRVDMTTHSLSYPCEFVQQELAISLANTSAIQTVSLTGFRSGEVKAIELWLTKDSDTSGATKNPLKWYAPLDVQTTYAGDVYFRADAGSSALWNLVNSRQTPRVAGISLAYAGGAYSQTAENYAWAEAPFGQAYVDDTAQSMYVSGKEITNGIIQLQLRTPSAAADWVLHASYVYNTVIVFSAGTADFAW